mmetsp:Transcript_751/g.1701  ORF Transcript_751/g.1701 Transcript_751/m.1701 type:complete len:203 (-) Transcript_751:70-678(-)
MPLLFGRRRLFFVLNLPVVRCLRHTYSTRISLAPARIVVQYGWSRGAAHCSTCSNTSSARLPHRANVHAAACCASSSTAACGAAGAPPSCATGPPGDCPDSSRLLSAATFSRACSTATSSAAITLPPCRGTTGHAPSSNGTRANKAAVFVAHVLRRFCSTGSRAASPRGRSSTVAGSRREAARWSSSGTMPPTRPAVTRSSL